MLMQARLDGITPIGIKIRRRKPAAPTGSARYPRDMRRSTMLPILAAATVVGHLAYHLATDGRDGQSDVEPARVIQGPLVKASPPPAPPPPSCADRHPIAKSDWRPMAAALRLHLAAMPGLAGGSFGYGLLVTRLQTCLVDLDGDLTDLHAKTASGGTWFGAHFRKNDLGWTVFRLDGGDAR
jgi:hypothetical protein